MVDIAHQVTHWREGALEDWQVSQDLLAKGRIRHTLFFVHLALEKLLKAIVCEGTQDLAPRTHNLIRLLELTGLQASEAQLRVLATTNEFSQAGRYPDSGTPAPTPEQARLHADQADEVFQWLMSTFSPR